MALLGLNGNGNGNGDGVKQAANSAALILAGRIALLLLVPIAGWSLKTVVDMRSDVAAFAMQLHADKDETTRRLDSLDAVIAQRGQTREQQVSMLQSQVAGINATLSDLTASVAQGQVQTQKQLDRLDMRVSAMWDQVARISYTINGPHFVMPKDGQ